MRKVVLMMLLAVVSSSAMAEWVNYGNNEVMTGYADPSTIRKSGNRVKMWTLSDLHNPKELAGVQFLSMKGQYEYDCKKEQLRPLHLTFHTESMGRGEVISKVDSNTKWEPVPPKSIAEDFLKVACLKK